MALNYVTCANSIVDALLQGRDIPSDMKEDAKKTWERIFYLEHLETKRPRGLHGCLSWVAMGENSSMSLPINI